MSKYLCADCALREQCDSEWTTRCASYVPKEHKQTNEEHLKSLDTEQLAEWLVEVTQYCFECGLNTNNCVFCPFGKCIDKGFAMEWLKKPYSPK